MIFLLLILESETDRSLIGDLFTLNYHRMKRTAMEMLHEPAAAEDAVQDTFVCCMKKVETLRVLPEHARSVYLLTALRHNALNRIKKEGMYSNIPAEQVEIPDGNASVEERAIKSLTVAEVKDAFSKLPESLKDVLRYKYLLELNDAEIASALGVSKSSIRVYLMRARSAVLKLVKEKDYAKEGI